MEKRLIQGEGITLGLGIKSSFHSIRLEPSHSLTRNRRIGIRTRRDYSLNAGRKNRIHARSRAAVMIAGFESNVQICPLGSGSGSL